MENVLAAEYDRGLVPESADHANTAVILFRIVLVQLEINVLLVVLINTLLV